MLTVELLHSRSSDASGTARQDDDAVTERG